MGTDARKPIFVVGYGRGLVHKNGLWSKPTPTPLPKTINAGIEEAVVRT
jgi:hypothetical protein